MHTLNTLEISALDMQTCMGFSEQQQIGFKDVSKFERALGIQIFVFYRSGSNMLLKYQTSDTPHSRTAFLYLHNDHYYFIWNLKAFLGEPYVCQFCHAGFSNRRDHSCKFSCDVCNDSECYTKPRKTKYCNDCSRYCKSSYCFNKHKQPVSTGESGTLVAPCNVTKYCKKCNRRYHVSVKNPKVHKCVAGVLCSLWQRFVARCRT